MPTDDTPKRPRRSSARQPQQDVEPLSDDVEDDQEEQDRPVAVGLPDWLADEPAEDPAETAVEDEPAEVLSGDEPPVEDTVERPGDEIATGVACLALAASTFLPWYSSSLAGVSGFASGTWGPIVFFLGIAGALIVLLRRLRVGLQFPFEAGTILEGIGWISVLALIVKRFLPPTIAGLKLGPGEPVLLGGRLSLPWLASLACAFAVVFFGGRVSTGAPFVMRPGWFRSKAGQLGAGLLAIALIAGVAVGMTMDATGDDPSFNSDASEPITYRGKVPPCLKGVPIAKGLKVQGGSLFKTQQGGETCTATFTTKLSVKRTVSRIKDSLAGKVQFRDSDQRVQNGALLFLAKPCGLVNIARLAKRTSVSYTLVPQGMGCPYAQPPFQGGGPTPGP